MVENLEKQSLISQRLIYDHMYAKEVGAHDIVLKDKLRRFCLASSSKLKQILAEKKKKKRKRKEKVLSEKEKPKERFTEEIGKVLQQI